MLVRDPVHGDIYFTKKEQKIIDCPAIQRLRGVKQLGTTYLVYPGATHTRFNHSLGTAFIAKQIIKGLEKKGFIIDEPTKELISIAGLVHDCTHVPYGHTFEDERRIFDRHDKKDYFQDILNKGLLGDLLEGWGIKKELLNMLVHTDPMIKTTKEPWKGQIINDTICADLLDYLRRDCYYTGITKDYDDRIFDYFIIQDDKLVLDFVKNMMERSDARSEILHLLRLRYFLTERVYYHHAKLASGAMISKALELASKENLITRDDLYHFNDWSLLHFLKNEPIKRDKTDPIRKLVEGVEERRLLKRAFVLSSSSLSSRGSREKFIKKFNPPTSEREQVEQMIIDRLRKETKDKSINASDVIIHCLSSSALKEAEVLIKNINGELTRLNQRPHPSADIKALEDAYEDLWRMYVFASSKHTKKVSKICEETFGRENEYKPAKK
ncbi:MAG: HD domain-containing protein [Asgard group archaeon]|nr:HD domain-containing protein [Asgard group archaeon]